jgi:O-6-methylguanine DNA methyltransferase
MDQALIETPVGPLLIAATGRGLRLIEFADSTRPDVLARAAVSESPASDPAAAEIVVAAQRQLNEYFDGARREFDLPLDVVGTEFQRRVWQTIASISFGQTLTYSEVAIAAGAPNAYRAAGTACGANPVVIFIPCHRVVGSDRGLHGFGGGLDRKVWLLRHEGSAGRLKADAWVQPSPWRRRLARV